jgi:GTP pyrophosphokinase
VGYGGMAAMYVVSRLLEEQRAHESPSTAPVQVPQELSQEDQLRARRAHHGIVLTGSEDLDIPVRFAKCCSPVPGDEIVGYITRGRGVVIHKAECANVAAGEQERRIPVEWAMENEGSTFYTNITILAYDRMNLLGEIANTIGENNVSIRAASIQASDKTKISTLKLTLDVHSREEMDRVISALRNKSDILDVYRSNQ